MGIYRAIQDAMSLLDSSGTVGSHTLPTASHLGVDVVHGSRHTLELAKSLAEGMCQVGLVEIVMIHEAKTFDKQT